MKGKQTGSKVKNFVLRNGCIMTADIINLP